MNTRRLRRSLIGILFCCLSLSLVSCQRPQPPTLAANQWTIVSQTEQPDAIDADGVQWIPRKIADQEAWVYYPQPVIEAIGFSQWNAAGTALSVTVSGRTWTLRRTEDKCEILAPWDTTPGFIHTIGPQKHEDPSDRFFLYLVAIIVGIVLIALLLLVQSQREEKHRATLAAWEAEQARKAEAVRYTESARQAEQKQRELDQQHKHELAEAEHKEWWRVQEAQERLANLAESLKQSAGQVELVDGMLRQLIEMGVGCGQMITVKFMMNTAARVGLEWAVHGPADGDVKVVLKLGGTILKSDCALESRYGYQLPRRGKPFTFTFDVYSGGHSWKEDVVLTLRVPTAKEWARTPGGEGQESLAKEFERFNARRNELRQLQEDAYQKIKDSNLDEDEKERWRADIDDFVIEQQEKLGE